MEKTTTSTTAEVAKNSIIGLSVLLFIQTVIHFTATQPQDPPPEEEVVIEEKAKQPLAQTTRFRPPKPTNLRRPSPISRPSRGERPRRGSDRDLKVTPEKELMITDLRVIEDPLRTNPENGDDAVWSFRYMMENMAGDNDPADFTLKWLEQWETDQVINGQTSPARPGIRHALIDPWLAASGGERLDLNKAPFKLLAIVNRLDLRDHDRRTVHTAGEGRFVFGVLNEEGMPLPPVVGEAAGGFIVIFEYELVADEMRELDKWAQKWHNLGRYSLGSERYKENLEKITRGFTDAGKAPNKANQNSINQIRTNEFSFGPNWELREFVLDAETGLLKQHTVAQTPDTLLANGTPDFAQLINDYENDLMEGNFSTPAAWLGATSVTGPFLPTDFPDFEERTFTTIAFFEEFVDIPWSAEGIANNEARHKFALNTCNGCHRHETNTDFVQITFPEEHSLPASLGKEAALAGFLTGIEVEDPVVPGESRSFNDIERRVEDLKTLLEHIRRNGNVRPPRKSHRPKFVH